MNNLTIADTKTTPEISFDATSGVLQITGESYPESAMQFYEPVLKWLGSYVPEAGVPITMNLKLSYFNTSSSKCILDILGILEDAFAQGKDVRVNWYHREDDEDMQESGEEFAEDMKLPFQILAY